MCTLASACPEEVLSALDVATTSTWISHGVTPAGQAGTVDGAVYMPVESIEPSSEVVAGEFELGPKTRVQVTLCLLVPVKLAVNLCFAATATDCGVGET